MKSSPHLHQASTNSIGYPSDAGSCIALSRFHCVVLQLTLRRSGRLTSRMEECAIFFKIPVHIAD